MRKVEASQGKTRENGAEEKDARAVVSGSAWVRKGLSRPASSLALGGIHKLRWQDDVGR